MEVKFSKGAKTSETIEEIEALLQAKWALDKDNMAVEKTYYFKTYAKGQVRFSNIIATLSNNCRNFSMLLQIKVAKPIITRIQLNS